MRARLFCRTGDLAGADHQIAGEATIGRSARNTVVLGAPVISQTHARIFFDAEAGGYILEDLRSRNGTRLDGVPVQGRERLGDLHVVTLGEEHDFIFVALPESATATVDGGHALKSPGSGAPPDTASETVYDHRSVLEMPALTDAPAAKDEGEQPGGGQTVYEPPSALQAPSFEAPPEAADDAAVSAPETVHEPPSALELPPLQAGEQGSVSPEAATSFQPAPGLASARAVLEVTAADGSRFRVELGEGRHDIGRARDCAVRIDDRTLSRKHAVVTVEDSVVTIEDLDSENGTFMDGKRLMAPVRLRVGDVVTLGEQVTLRLVDP